MDRRIEGEVMLYDIYILPGARVERDYNFSEMVGADDILTKLGIDHIIHIHV